MEYMVVIALLRTRQNSFFFHDFCEELLKSRWQAGKMEVGLGCFHLKPWMGNWKRLMMGSA
jgi:hypothetical protein